MSFVVIPATIVGSQVIEQFRRETSSLAHSCDVGLGFESDGHHARNSSLMLVSWRAFSNRPA
jgi:hypothetical protein